MVTAALGGEFEVPTIDKGKSRIKIPAGPSPASGFALHQRHADPALAPDRRHVCPGFGRNAAESHQETAGIAGRIRKIIVGRDPAEAVGFFTKVKDFFGNRAN